LSYTQVSKKGNGTPSGGVTEHKKLPRRGMGVEKGLCMTINLRKVRGAELGGKQEGGVPNQILFDWKKLESDERTNAR